MSTEQIVIGIVAVVALFAALFDHMDKRQTIQQLRGRLRQFADESDPPGPRPKNPHNAATNDILKAMAKNIENSASEKLAQYLVARPPEYRIGPAERIVTIPKDVWAELQAMPNDGSWSTRHLVRAIQRANKKKRGAP